jgi:16S rRNA (adenine1518-N6/adenine1519-N6)-dimethyltransferase
MSKNIKPNKKLGQNFLINKYTINTLMEILAVSEDDYVVEIGPGKGALTEHLIKKTKNYIGIEKDKILCEYLLEKFQNNIDIRNEDILKTNFNSLHKKNFKVIGNIPYNISTKILLMCMEQRNKINEIYLMMQKEFVERVIANNNNKNYGRLSIIMQLYFETQKYIDINPSDFYPEPKVYSSFMSLRPRKKILINEFETDDFLNFVKKIFQSRRKKIRNCLNVNYKDLYGNINKRAEELSIPEMIELFRDINNDGKLI